MACADVLEEAAARTKSKGTTAADCELRSNNVATPVKHEHPPSQTVKEQRVHAAAMQQLPSSRQDGTVFSQQGMQQQQLPIDSYLTGPISRVLAQLQ